MTRRRILIVGGLVLLAFGSLAYAQRIFVGGGGRSRFRPNFATLEDFDGSFLYCRGFYRSNRGEAGGQGWSTDYPGADNNFLIRLSELTRVSVKWDPERQPIYVVVRLDDPLLYRCPMLFMEDVGTIQFSASEIVGLRNYLLKGGFLWVDDFWGSRAWDQWVVELQRVLPNGEYPIIDVPVSHAIMHTVYDVTDYLQVSSINFWYRSNGSVSERGSDSAQVHYRGIEDSRQRLMVLMTHNTDVADTWEREGENKEYFSLFSPRGYAIGVNVVVYALTH
jgi:uncharacterized protein DUF4159